jgi:signal recognition particle subunit SRP54
MGSLDEIVGMIPGIKPGALKDAKVDEKAMAHTEAIILSMTDEEREHPNLINGSRRKRIAMGSGTTVEEVNRLLRQYDQMSKMIKTLSGQMIGKRGKKKMKLPLSFG